MAQAETLEQVQRVGRQRLYPSLTNPNWLILRKRRELFRRWLDRIPSGNLTVLDVGGRIQPYRPLIGSPDARYVAVDLRPTPLVNIVANAEHLPLRNEVFDLVFCTQMLEYVPNPSQVIVEIYRVLKPGGTLLLSVPTAFPRDADEDRWRFLPAGITQLLAPFSVVEVVPEGGSITGLLRTASVCLHVFAKYPVIRKFVSYTLVPLLNCLGFGLEELVRSRNDVFSVNYSAMAMKGSDRSC
jgi:SAM-dependent methyltransferase